MCLQQKYQNVFCILKWLIMIKCDQDRNLGSSKLQKYRVAQMGKKMGNLEYVHILFEKNIVSRFGDYFLIIVSLFKNI